MLKQSLSILTAGLLSAVAISACGDSGADGGAGGQGGETSTKATTGATKASSGAGPTTSSSTGAGPTTGASSTAGPTTGATTVATTVASSSSTGALIGADGSNCMVDADCNGGLCLTEADSGLPGGMCTEDCAMTGMCTDANSTCFNVGGGLCLRNCDPAVMNSCGAPATLDCVDTTGAPTPGACIGGCTASADCTVAGNVCDTNSTACEAPEICDNGMDDNGDSEEDCSDGQCFAIPACAENCTNGIDDNGNGDVDCQDAVCAADPACIPPAGWNCNPAFYNVNDGCDCECGAPDPDCNLPMPNIFGCGDETINGATCVAGECVPGAAYTCAANTFVDGVNCDCECGVEDPDCDNGLPTAGCMAGEICVANVCELACGDGTCDPATECGAACPADCTDAPQCGFCDATPATCDVEEACTCDSCDMDAFCTDPTNCNDDGVCDQFLEGCQCTDCAGVMNCL